MSNQAFSELISTATSDGTPVANSTTETIIYNNVIAPANYIQNARSLRFRLFGKYSTTGTPTLIFRIRWGGIAGTVLAVSPAITTPSGVTNATFDMDIILVTRTSGSAGTVMCNGTMSVHAAVAPTVASATGNAGTTPLTAGGVTAPAAVTIDATADTAIAVSAQWSAASASNTLTGLNYLLESLN